MGRLTGALSCALLLVPLDTGCVLLHDGSSDGGSGGGGATTSQGGGGAGTDGGGGSGGRCNQYVTPETSFRSCPSTDYTLALGDPATNVTGDLGVVSTMNGTTTIVGTFDASFSVGGAAFTYLSGKTNFFVLRLDANGEADWGYSVKAAFGPRATHLIVTNDGGVAFAISGAAFRLDDAEFDLASLDDTSQDDALIVKLAEDGAHQWHLQLEGGQDPMFADLLQLDPQDNIVIGGRVLGNFGTLQIKQGNDPEPNVVPTSTGDSFFLLTYSNAGGRLDAPIWRGNARTAGVRWAGGFRYIVGSYEGAFPDFGLSNPPDRPDDGELFAARLAGGGVADRQRSFGFEGRDDTALAIADTGDGTAVFANTASNTAPSTFSDDAGLTLDPNDGASVVIKLDDELEPEWARANVLGGPAVPRTGFVPKAGGLWMSHDLGASGSVDFDGQTYTSPATDSLFVALDGCGDPLGKFAVAPGEPGTLADLNASTSACGDLVFGTHGGTSFDLLGGTIAESASGKTQAVAVFRSAGMPLE